MVFFVGVYGCLFVCVSVCVCVYLCVCVCVCVCMCVCVTAIDLPEPTNTSPSSSGVGAFQGMHDGGKIHMLAQLYHLAWEHTRLQDQQS